MCLLQLNITTYLLSLTAFFSSSRSLCGTRIYQTNVPQFLVEVLPSGRANTTSPWTRADKYNMISQFRSLASNSYLFGAYAQLASNKQISHLICQTLRAQKLHMLALLRVDPYSAVKQFLPMAEEDMLGIHIVDGGEAHIPNSTDSPQFLLMFHGLLLQAPS